MSVTKLFQIEVKQSNKPKNSKVVVPPPCKIVNFKDFYIVSDALFMLRAK